MLVKATVKCQTTFTCSLCGKTENGETARFEFTGDAADLYGTILHKSQNPMYMPIGWTGGYRNSSGEFVCGLKCGTCGSAA